jgi:hypothetical protein
MPGIFADVTADAAVTKERNGGDTFDADAELTLPRRCKRDRFLHARRRKRHRAHAPSIPQFLLFVIVVLHTTGGNRPVPWGQDSPKRGFDAVLWITNRRRRGLV